MSGEVLLFPLRFVPKESYHERPRSFGSPRDNGLRAHAGCDLYAPVGTEVLAVADGKVLAAYPFYPKDHPVVWAIEVDHFEYVIRYGEVTRNLAPGVKAGHTVARGQVVGHVGQMPRLPSMLHFEMYAGTASGALTDRSRKPYQRRSDLMDPTFYLDAAVRGFWVRTMTFV